jgi:hypothetical protein
MVARFFCSVNKIFIDPAEIIFLLAYYNLLQKVNLSIFAAY